MHTHVNIKFKNFYPPWIKTVPGRAILQPPRNHPSQNSICALFLNTSASKLLSPNQLIPYSSTVIWAVLVVVPLCATISPLHRATRLSPVPCWPNHTCWQRHGIGKGLWESWRSVWSPPFAISFEISVLLSCSQSLKWNELRQLDWLII